MAVRGGPCRGRRHYPFELWLMGLLFLGMAAGAQTTGAPPSGSPARSGPGTVALEPDRGRPGETLNVVAVGLPGALGLTLNFEPAGLLVSRLRFTDRDVAFQLDIAAEAPPGAYTLVVRGRDRRPVSYPAAFTVLPPDKPREPVQILRVEPQEVEAGKTYTLTLFGRGFVPGMTVHFGRDVQNLAPPFLQDAGRATLRVLVSPSALPGVRLARVQTPDGRAVEGPGGIWVRPAAPQTLPSTTPIHPPPFQVAVPQGKIFLRAPNITGSGEFVSSHMESDPPLVQQGTLFTWFEQNPGVAQYFVLAIKDKNGKVLAQVQTPASKNFYRVTRSLLLSLPPYEPGLTFHYSGPKGLYSQGLPSGAVQGAVGTGGAALPSQGVLSGLASGQTKAPVTKAQVESALALAKTMGNLTALVDPDLHRILPTDHADATWSVTGYWKHPITQENVAVETSEEYPLRLPRQPHGMLSCDAADQPGALAVICVDPKNPNDTRACLAGHEVHLSGQIRLDRNPYPYYVTPTSMGVQYWNVFLSWGDGEVTPLVVDMTPSGEPFVKIQHQGAALKHVYTDEGSYSIQIFSLPKPESSNPTLPALIQSHGPYAQALQGLLPGGSPGASQGPFFSSLPSGQGAGVQVGVGALQGGAVKPGTAQPAAGGPGATMSPSLEAAQTLGKEAYLIACVGVNPKLPEDMVATGPLHLVKVEITGFPGRSEKPPQVPKVQDCSQGFTARAELSYYGQGEVGWSWIVDGAEIPGGTRHIGPGKKTPPADPEILVSDPLPVTLTGTPHTLAVRAWVVHDLQSHLIAAGPLHAGANLPLKGTSSLPGTGTPSYAVQSYNVLRPSLLGFASLGAVVTSSSTPPKKGLGDTPPQKFTLPSGVLPPSTVQSSIVEYEVVAHDPQKPCSLLFQTAKGPFVVTDLGDDFVERPDGTYDGSGLLLLTLPEGQSGTFKVLVPVSFKGWTLKGTGDGREVVQGLLDVTPNQDLNVVGLTGKVVRVQGTAGETAGDVAVTFRLQPSPYASLKAAGGSLAFTAEGPITPEGDFRAGDLHLPAADVGYSGYQVSASDAVLDLSRNEGEAPAETACNATGTGPTWVGLLLRQGMLKTGNLSLVPVPLPNVPFTRWSVGPGGLSGSITAYPLKASLPLGLTTLEVNAFDFFVCGNHLTSTFGLTVSNYPFLNGTLTGTSTIDEHGVSQNTFDVPPVDKDFGTIHYTSSNGRFDFEPGVGWRVVLDGTFRFKAFGQPAYDGLPLNGLEVLPTGHLRLEGGVHSQHIPLGGSGNVGQTPVEVTGADVVAVDYGGSTAKALFFKLNVGFHLSTTLSVTPSVLHYSFIPVPGEEGHFSAADPKVDDLHIENHYPYNSEVNMSATISYKDMGAGNTRFSGQAQLQLLSGTVNAEFLLGYQGGEDYWLTRVGYDLGANPVAILPPFLLLYEVHGALGHNINFAEAVAGVPIDQIHPVLNGSYLFQAGCQVGDGFAAGWIYYFDGTFTVDTQQGPRIDAKGWLLTSHHAGSAPLNGTLQYGGGAFTANLYVALSYLDGALSLHGNANIRLGNGWHVWVGTNTQPVNMHVLVSDCTGYLMLDGNGLRIGGGYDGHFHANPTLFGVGGYVDFDYELSIDLGLSQDSTYGIHVEGTFSASIHGSAGVTIKGVKLGIDLGGGLAFSASAMPVEVCGKVWLDFGCLCVCPCWDFSWTCCCKCFKTHFEACLP